MISPAVTLLLILVIGIAIGLVIYQYAGSNWLSQLTGTSRGQLTNALAGIAGAFIGYHLAIVFGSVGASTPLIFAAVAAALLVWGWRTVKVMTTYLFMLTPEGAQRTKCQRTKCLA